MSKTNTLNQTSSEVNTLATRGYRLLSKLGEGSYAKVYISEYRAANANAGADQPAAAATTLACKIIDTKKVTKNFVNKFLPRELDCLVRVSHPHIIHVHSIFQRRTKYYIFMRFAENGDLLDFILKDGAISEPQTRFWARQISLALQYLHRMQIAHRDIKCENILVTSNNNVKLCDFGFSRSVVDAQNRRQLSETFCGSLSYAAPEILKGLAYAPKVSDMWALGVLVFTMLNKAMPFDDTHATQLYENQVHRRWKFGYRVASRLSPEVRGLVKRLLEPDVKKRLRIDEVVAHPWFAMDPRLKTLNPYELAAMKAAAKISPAIDEDADISSIPQNSAAEYASNTTAGVEQIAAAATTAATTATTAAKTAPKQPVELIEDAPRSKLGPPQQHQHQEQQQHQHQHTAPARTTNADRPKRTATETELPGHMRSMSVLKPITKQDNASTAKVT